MTQIKQETGLAQALNYLRSKGIVQSQKEMAEIMNADAGTLSSAINGNPKALTRKFCVRFNRASGSKFNLDFLLTGKGDMLLHQEDNEDKYANIVIPEIKELLQTIDRQNEELLQFKHQVEILRAQIELLKELYITTNK